MQKYVKKGEPSRFRDGNKSQHRSISKDEDHPFQPLQNVIGEIATIARGPFTGGSFRSLKKSIPKAGEQRLYGTLIQTETNESRYDFQRG